MNELAAFGIGAVGTQLASGGVRSIVGHRTRHLKENYRGRTLIATGGLVLVFSLLLGGAIVVSETGPTLRLVALVGAPLSMAILGLVDDLYGNRQAGGLFGHARELLRGHLTTGMMKAAGGALVGLVAAALLGHRGVWIVVGGAVVALAANLANLLDLRPVRTIKVWLPCTVAAIALTAGTPDGLVLAALAGGAVVFAFYELRETVMLGDVGANLLGSATGVAAAAGLDGRGLVICACALLAVTLLSELVSFSRIIEAAPPLRWLDRLGRRA